MCLIQIFEGVKEHNGVGLCLSGKSNNHAESVTVSGFGLFPIIYLLHESDKDASAPCSCLFDINQPFSHLKRLSHFLLFTRNMNGFGNMTYEACPSPTLHVTEASSKMFHATVHLVDVEQVHAIPLNPHAPLTLCNGLSIHKAFPIHTQHKVTLISSFHATIMCLGLGKTSLKASLG